MIQRLYIRNYAIIDEVALHFSDKLNIITGETGAGKSIILDTIGLIMGNRADTKILKHEDQKCVIEGLFDIQAHDLKDFFEENDLDYDTEITIRREISPSGKSRAFINDTPARLDQLRVLTARLIDLHQQFDTLDIHQEEFQMQMLDALAKNKDQLTAYQTLYKSYNSNKRRLQKLIDENERASKEMDFIEFQLEELTTAALIEEEQEELEQELETLSNAENIKLFLTKGFQVLSEEEQAVISALNDLANEINTVSRFHPELKKIMERYEGLVIELQDIANEFENIAEQTEYDEERIQVVQERLDLIYRLQNKHHVSDIKALLGIQATLQSKVDNFSDSTAEMSKLEAIIDEQEEELREKGEILTQKRQAVIPFFEEEIHKMLTQLSMQHARLKIELKPIEDPTHTGFDEVAFLFAANKGSRLDLIKNVASGGELSRLALCTKSLVASAITLPTLIFDEIDTGVSGDVALKMGHILRDLANRHQVISITHTPQIASKADHHYFVFKQVQGETTTTNVRLLNREERITEIATMLSGNPPSENALSNAQELIGM